MPSAIIAGSLWELHFETEIGCGYSCAVFCDWLFCWHVLNDTQEVRNWLAQGSMKKVSYTDLDGLEVSETFKCKVKVQFAIFSFILYFGYDNVVMHWLMIDNLFMKVKTIFTGTDIFMSLCAQVHVWLFFVLIVHTD